MSSIADYANDISVYASVNASSFMINTGGTVTFDGNVNEKLINLQNLRNISIDYDSKDEKEEPLPNTVDFCIQYNKFKNEEKDIAEQLNIAEKSISEIKNNQEIILKALKDLEVNTDTFDMIQSIIVPHANELIEKYNIEYTLRRLKELQDKIAIYLVLLNEVKNEFFNETKDIDNWTCSICYDSRIDHVITSCGHTLCGKCKIKIKDKCFVCRKNIDKVIKLFTT